MKNILELFKKHFLFIAFILVTIFFFEYSVSVLWDSAHYMNYVNILEGVTSWDQWDVVRGPVFPVLIFVSNYIFGKTNQGLIMNTYLFYIIMLVFTYKILRLSLKDKEYSKDKKNIIIYAFIFFMIIINPIIYGFYHSLLTEFVAITLSVVSCYYAYRFLKTDFFKNKKKFITLVILFAILTCFSWFLKQPYVSCGIFALIIASFISMLEKRNLKNILSRIIAISVCAICLSITMNLWNNLLLSKGNNPNTDRNPTNSLGNQLVSAIYFLEIDKSDEIYTKEYIESSKLSKKEKKELLSKKEKDYVIINIMEDDKIKESDYVNTTDRNISTINSCIYILTMFIKEPINLIDSYVTNYLSIIDIYSTISNNGIGYESSREIDLKYANEIGAIAYRTYYYGLSNIYDMTDEMYERVECYEQVNMASIPINFVMIKLGIVFLIIFKLIFLMLPIVLCSTIVIRLTTKKNHQYKNKLNLSIILLGFSFLHVLLHTVTGAVIDRYAVPAFITTILGTLIFVDIIITNIKLRKKKSR